ncbi:unnamed protein product [Arctogadus glacialis]
MLVRKSCAPSHMREDGAPPRGVWSPLLRCCIASHPAHLPPRPNPHFHSSNLRVKRHCGLMPLDTLPPGSRNSPLEEG